MPYVQSHDHTKIATGSQQFQRLSNYQKATINLPSRLLNQLHPEMETFLNFDLTTHKGIPVWQTKKIRNILTGMSRYHGFGIRWKYRISFMGHAYMSIPQNTLIDFVKTDQEWEKVENRWRRIWIYDVIVTGTNEGNLMQILSVITGSELGLNIVPDWIKGNTMRSYEFFENMISYDGINDVIIISNWDKVRELLMSYGF